MTPSRAEIPPAHHHRRPPARWPAPGRALPAAPRPDAPRRHPAPPHPPRRRIPADCRPQYAAPDRRPNVSYPTYAAKTFATLDQISEGRLTVHFIT
ncbi:hypothetical protein ACFWJT_38175, partial [Streptomyces sp. NPDC127069]